MRPPDPTCARRGPCNQGGGCDCDRQRMARFEKALKEMAEEHKKLLARLAELEK